MSMPAPAHAQTPHPEPGGEMFECARAFLGIARELANASGLCIGLEGNVMHLVAQYQGEDRAVLMREVQALDVLNQLLVALSSYASVLGAQCIAGAPLDVDGASREMGLARVAASLRGLTISGDSEMLPAPATPGDMDLF